MILKVSKYNGANYRPQVQHRNDDDIPPPAEPAAVELDLRERDTMNTEGAGLAENNSNENRSIANIIQEEQHSLIIVSNPQPTDHEQVEIVFFQNEDQQGLDAIHNQEVEVDKEGEAGYK